MSSSETHSKAVVDAQSEQESESPIAAPSVASVDGLTTDEVHAELARVVASRAFSKSVQLASFLRYVVEESIAGRAENIKERNIAINALQRRSDYDSSNDSIVRVTAVRLRRALKEYYEESGASSPIQIDVPKGAYVPTFRRCTSMAADDDPLETNGDSQPESTGRGGGQHWMSGQRTASGLVAIVVVLGAGFGIFFAVRHFSPLAPPSSTSPAPASADLVQQTGALPYRNRDGRWEVLLVRTRRDSHWTIPKVTQEAELTPWHAAKSEALAEAGVRGVARSTSIGEYFYDRNDRTYRVTVYPVQVEQELPQSERARQWYDLQRACEVVESDQLCEVINRFEPPE